MSIRYSFVLAVVVCTIGAFVAPRARSDEAPLVVFAAASLKGSLDDIASRWQAETGNGIVISYAASSALIRQIEAGAPADIFASADLDWMAHGEARGLVNPRTRVHLLGNRLVIVAPASSNVSLIIAPGFDLAGAAGEGRIAIGEVQSVPAGKYARAALEKLGVWASIESKLAMTDNVRAALALVARSEISLGIVYATDAKTEPGVKVVALFPESSHPPIIYPFAITAASKNPKALDFLSYLRGPQARAKFKDAGFQMLAE